MQSEGGKEHMLPQGLLPDSQQEESSFLQLQKRLEEQHRCVLELTQKLQEVQEERKKLEFRVAELESKATESPDRQRLLRECSWKKKEERRSVINEVLNRWRIEVVQSLDVRHPIDVLRQNGCITREQAAEIQAGKTSQDRARLLLERIEKNGPQAFESFLQSLKEENPNLFDCLKLIDIGYRDQQTQTEFLLPGVDFRGPEDAMPGRAVPGESVDLVTTKPTRHKCDGEVKAFCLTMQNSPEFDVLCPLEKQPWFHKWLTRLEAEDALKRQPRGTYLVRHKTAGPGYSLSFRTDDDVHHVQIEETKDGNFSIENVWNISVPHLIYYLTTKKSLASDGSAIQLSKPYTTKRGSVCTSEKTEQTLYKRLHTT